MTAINGTFENLRGLTPVQKRMLDLLKDGAPHAKEELHRCLSDDLGDLANIRPHLTGIRKLLPDGWYLGFLRINGAGFYRLMRHDLSDVDS